MRLRTVLVALSVLFMVACGQRTKQANKGYPGSTNAQTTNGSQGVQSAPGTTPGTVTGSAAGNGSLRNPHPAGSSPSPQEGVTGPGGTTPNGQPAPSTSSSH